MRKILTVKLWLSLQSMNNFVQLECTSSTPHLKEDIFNKTKASHQQHLKDAFIEANLT